MTEDPDCPEPDWGDRNGEPAEDDYDLGCVILAAFFAACSGATVAILVFVTLR